VISPDNPYTQDELERIEAMVAKNMADPVSPISEELSRELAEFRIAAEACERFILCALAYLEKHGARAAVESALPEGW
jgi:hypothetical protein